MICSAGAVVLYCVYGLHSLIHNLETGTMEVVTAPGVVLCSTPRGGEGYYSTTRNIAKCPKDTIAEVCRCEPYGAINLKEE